ncbi:MAG TPA: citrate/2-methylcitrate synthase [Brevundimonas sp.]
MDAQRGWIGRGEALARLGVKPQTLYAYVSRGRITAQPDPHDPRRSLYAEADIARLTGDPDAPPAPTPRKAPGRGEVELKSAVSLIEDGRLFYRGLDAAQLSEQATLEDVARRLWDVRDNPFAALKPRVDLVGGASIRTRLFACLGRRAEEDASSLGRDAQTLVAEAASVLNEAVDAAAGSGPRTYFHQRLGRGWKVMERDAHMLRRALVLAADQGLDAPAVAARAAAGGGAPMAGAALAGLTTLYGSSLSREVARASAWVVEARRDPARVTAHRMQTAGSVPGFGDTDWPEGDLRAAALLAAMDLPRDLDAVVREGTAATGLKPTFALALSVLARRLDLPRDGALDLLLIGRLAGLLGHALDQRNDGSPMRVRLRYVGPEPGAH